MAQTLWRGPSSTATRGPSSWHRTVWKSQFVLPYPICSSPTGGVHSIGLHHIQGWPPGLHLHLHSLSLSQSPTQLHPHYQASSKTWVWSMYGMLVWACLHVVYMVQVPWGCFMVALSGGVCLTKVWFFSVPSHQAEKQVCIHRALVSLPWDSAPAWAQRSRHTFNRWTNQQWPTASSNRLPTWFASDALTGSVLEK